MLDRLKDLICQVVEEDERFRNATREATIFEDLGLSSVSMLYLVLAMEQEFGVELANDTIMGFVTVGDLCDYLEANATT